MEINVSTKIITVILPENLFTSFIGIDAKESQYDATTTKRIEEIIKFRKEFKSIVELNTATVVPKK